MGREMHSEDTLKTEIRELLRRRNAVLLAHNYQRDEIQEIADITGDSLGLSQEAAKSRADVIVFCGVHFMAESAAILSPDKRVLLPRLDAGCPNDVRAGDDPPFHRDDHAGAEDRVAGGVANLDGEVAQVLKPDVIAHVAVVSSQ